MKNLVIVEFPAKKEKFEDLKNTLKEALVDTRAFEGCISIDTYEDKTTNTIYLIEDWESLDQQPHQQIKFIVDLLDSQQRSLRTTLQLMFREKQRVVH